MTIDRLLKEQLQVMMQKATRSVSAARRLVSAHPGMDKHSNIGQKITKKSHFKVVLFI